jgi:hypothetical protein
VEEADEDIQAEGGGDVRLIDADALKEKKVYSHERHEKIVPVAEIDWSPTIDAIPVEWMEAQDNIAVKATLAIWQKKQEAR